MKLYDIDNPNLACQFGDVIQIITKGKKAIILPADVEIITTGGYLPHVKSHNRSNTVWNTLKYCHRCKNWKPLEKFIKNKYSKDGYKDACSSCDNERRRKRYRETKAVT